MRAHLHRAVAAEREGALRVARRAEDSAAAAKEAGERRELKEIALAARDRKRSVASAAAEEAPEAPKSGGFGFMRRGRQRKKRRVAEAVKAADVAKESGKAAVRCVSCCALRVPPVRAGCAPDASRPRAHALALLAHSAPIMNASPLCTPIPLIRTHARAQSGDVPLSGRFYQRCAPKGRCRGLALGSS